MSKAVKILFLNLPASEQITRRYMCSYPSPESLLPPIEMASCAAVARTVEGVQVSLTDAIAEKKNLRQTLAAIGQINPTVIVALSGFECIEDDINIAAEIKGAFPATGFVWFGHYATEFAESILKHSNADMVILGEPENTLKDLLGYFLNEKPITAVQNIATLINGSFTLQGSKGRINNPNELPMPAYDLLKDNSYYEPFLKKPYGMIQTMRGCPYGCNYCVKSYGSKLSHLTSERVIDEIKYLVANKGIKSLRFIDDTFTVNRNRVIEICKALINQNINIEWVCLSRSDNLDEDMLQWMKRSGCRRIYFGIESGSQRMLDMLGKGIKAREALEVLLLCSKLKIETAGFFMSGHPHETEEDFLESIRFAIQSKLNFVSISPIQPYPGTLFYEQVKDKVDFSFYPYKNEWKDKEISRRFATNKTRFYSGFYLRLSFVALNARIFLKDWLKTAGLAAQIVRYVFGDRKFVIGGIKARQEV